MDKFVVADVDADMPKRVAAGVEKYEVSRLQIVPGDPFAHSGLFTGGPGQADVEKGVDFS